VNVLTAKREESKKRRNQVKKTGWRIRASREVASHLPPRASRVRQSENRKDKQFASMCCLSLRFSDCLHAGRQPAAADAYDSFESSLLRIFDVDRRCVSA